MTGLHDKRVTRESRRSSLERSRPAAAAAAPPPAHRTKHAEVPVPPRKRERSVPAARAARSLCLPDGERDSEDAAPAPPPPKRPRSAPSYGDDRDPTEAAVAPPPTAPRAAEAPVPRPHSAYALRNRDVPGTSDRHAPGGTSNRKPCIPARKEKREELKHDRPCSSRNKPKQPEPWEPISCARMGLEHYNSMNQQDEHELVKAVGVHSFIWSGMWLHANFVARSKGANSSVDIVPKMFFAELKIDAFGLSCASCVKIDSGESNNLGGCEHCQGKIMHPAYGFYLGSKDRRQAAAAGVYLGAEEDAQHADDADDADDLEIEFDF